MKVYSIRSQIILDLTTSRGWRSKLRFWAKQSPITISLFLYESIHGGDSSLQNTVHVCSTHCHPGIHMLHPLTKRASLSAGNSWSEEKRWDVEQWNQKAAIRNYLASTACLILRATPFIYMHHKQKKKNYSLWEKIYFSRCASILHTYRRYALFKNTDLIIYSKCGTYKPWIACTLWNVNLLSPRSIHHLSIKATNSLSILCLLSLNNLTNLGNWKSSGIQFSSKLPIVSTITLYWICKCAAIW